MNPQVEKFLKIPLYQRLLMVLGIMAVIGVGFYFLLFQPKMKEYNALVTKSSELQAEIVQKKSIADNLPKFKEEYGKMQKMLEESLKELPNDKEIPQLLMTIASLAKQNRLDIKKFDPSAETPRDFYAEVPVVLSLIGTYHDTGKFFFDVSEMPRIVNIGNIKVKPVAGSKGADKIQLTIDCQATTYRFLSAEEKGQAKKPTPGAKKK